MSEAPPASAAPSLLAGLARRPRGRVVTAHFAATAIVVAAVVVRLALGLHVALDGDEATEAVTAIRILHGHLALMESSGRYLGALDSYVLAPFIAVLGPTVLAVRVAEATLGGCYVALVYALGRRSLGGEGAALVVAAIASVFPLYAVTVGHRTSYALVLVLETLILLLSIRLAWPVAPAEPGRGTWAFAGFVAGIGLWSHPLLGLPIAAGLAAVVTRARAAVWRHARRGLIWAAGAALVGCLPWLVYNVVVSPLGSLRHLYSPAVAYTTSAGLATRFLLSTGLPIFMGARGDSCGTTSESPVAVDAILLTLALIVAWTRRSTLAALARGRLAALEPVDVVLAVAPLSLLATTLGPFNALYCQPRYLMPLAVPLVFALALALTAPLPLRLLGFALAAVWLAGAAPTALGAAGTLPGGGGAQTVDLAAAARQLRAERPEAVWADYGLARSIQFLTADSFPVGEYGGYVGYPDTQRAALAARHPSWLFSSGDPEVAAFRSECSRRGITYLESQPAPGLLLFASLSAPLTPNDLHLPGQRVDAV